MKHEEALKFCMESFLMTGSRYFNLYAPEIVPVNQMTDYDFTAPASNPWLMRFEASTGVKRVEVNSSYATKDVAYWLFYDEPSGFGAQEKPQIQVIVRPTDEIYRAYREVFAKITPEFYRDYIWKSAPGKEKTKQIVGERMYLLMQYEMCER